MTIQALLPKRDFIGLDDCSWFFSGAETPTHLQVKNAIDSYLTYRSRGPYGRQKNAETEWKCKVNLAKMLNGSPEQVTIMSNASEAISMIAQSIPFQAGDNVILHTLEFPSGVLPWLALKKRGVEVRVVPHHNWEIREEDILNLIDGRTRLVMTSHISYLSGARIDYRKLYERISQTDALLLLDATQSLGVIPVDMGMADMVVASTYKWLLSVHGGGVMAINRKRVNLEPRYVGWRSVDEQHADTRFQSFEFFQDARRFELGYPSYPTVYALECSTRLLLETGIERIERHVLQLGQETMEVLTRLGFQVMTPSDPQRRAGNICFVHDSPAEAAERLAERGVYVMGGDNRLRISLHAFNDSSDIERLVEHLHVCVQA